jgi:signal transduction histidine kinase
VFALTVLMTVALTIFAGYLLWRDLQREVHVSELRTQFVSSISHELKTPLTAIRMFAETLQMGRCTDPEIQTEYLGTIVNECERLTRLVEGVMLFSKAEQGKKIYRFRRVPLSEAVYAAARAIEYPFSQHGFRLHLAISDDERLVRADRDAVEQAVLNLLSNAMKFSGDSRDIELALEWQDDEAVILVTDHGIGIAPEEQSLIFDKYYRVTTPQNRLIPGAGLGLALVAQIAQAHGGRVNVESALGAGSTFYFRLPAAPPIAGARSNSHESDSCY